MSTSINHSEDTIDWGFDFDAYDAFFNHEQSLDTAAPIHGHQGQVEAHSSDELSNPLSPSLPIPHTSSGFQDQVIDPVLLQSPSHQAASAHDRLETAPEVDWTAITNDYAPFPAPMQTAVSAELYTISGSENYTGDLGFRNEVIDAMNFLPPTVPIVHQHDIRSTQPMSSNLQTTHQAPTANMRGAPEVPSMQTAGPSSSSMVFNPFRDDGSLDLSDHNDHDHIHQYPEPPAAQVSSSITPYAQRNRHFYGSQMPLDTLNQRTLPALPQSQSGPSHRVTRETISAQAALSPEPSRKRPAAAMTYHELPSSAVRIKRDCADCGKVFYNSQDASGLRCTRCQTKHVKNTAGHTDYPHDPDMSAQMAKDLLYPQMPPLFHPHDDVAEHRQYTDYYMRELCKAVSEPYIENNAQRQAQQAKMNKKPFDSDQYRAPLVNARLRILYETAVSYHAGGPTYYDIGGDNNGYGEDKSLPFSNRLNHIIELLRKNKDIAMDVIEGRGVTALVKNPDKYERRKRDNKKSNDTKAFLQEKGKRLEQIEKRTGSRSVVPGAVVESVEYGAGDEQVSAGGDRDTIFSEPVSDDMRQALERQHMWQQDEVGLGAMAEEVQQVPDGYSRQRFLGRQPDKPY